MKTRTNQPVLEIKVSDIQHLPQTLCNQLKCGDILCKEDETGKHSYIVSCKKDGRYFMLTYADCDNVETIVYENDGAWSFAEKTITPISEVRDLATTYEKKSDLEDDVQSLIPFSIGSIIQLGIMNVRSDSEPPFYTAYFQKDLTETEKDYFNNSNGLIVFMFNETSVVIPYVCVNTSIEQRFVISAIYDEYGTTMVARGNIRTSSGLLTISFDTAFAEAIYNSMSEIDKPYGIVRFIKFR